MEQSQQAAVVTVADSIARAFTTAGITYAIGGRLACNLWSAPRGTNCVVANVFLAPSGEHVDAVFAAIRGVFSEKTLDGYRDLLQIRDIAIAEGVCGFFVGDTRVWLFFSLIPIHDEIRDHHRVWVPASDGHWYLDATAVVFFKLLFGRRRDYEELPRLFAMGNVIDVPTVTRWLREAFPADDARFRLLEHALTFIPTDVQALLER